MWAKNQLKISDWVEENGQVSYIVINFLLFSPDSIEDNVETAAGHVEEGREELIKAARSQVEE